MRPPFCTMVLWSSFSSLFLIIFYFCLLKLTCLLFPWFQLFSNKWNGSMYRQTDGQTNGPTYRDVKLYLKIIVHSIHIYAIYCTSIFRNTRILIEMRGPSCCFYKMVNRAILIDQSSTIMIPMMAILIDLIKRYHFANLIWKNI